MAVRIAVVTAILGLGLCASCEEVMSAPAPDLAQDRTSAARALALGVGGAMADEGRSAAVLPHDSFLHRQAGAGVSVFIALQKTSAPRSTDTPVNARENGMRSVAGLARLRMREDVNFVEKTRRLAERIIDFDAFGRFPELATVHDGAEFLVALAEASRKAPIRNLVIYGHAAPHALYMLEDRGFYTAVGEVAKTTRMTDGTDAGKEETLRELGARDLTDLVARLRRREIRFEKQAVIVLAGCEAAGVNDVDRSGIAARIAEITGATVLASVGLTDQSMARGRGASSDREYSHGTWAQFARGAEPRKLGTREVDALKYLRSDTLPADASDAAEPSADSAHSDDRQLHCAAVGGAATASCGLGVHGLSAEALASQERAISR